MVTVNQVCAALVSSRGGDGVEWSAVEWARVWSVLTTREQEVVYWHLLEGLSHTEVGEQLGIGRGAVDGAWRRALVRIRAALPH